MSTVLAWLLTTGFANNSVFLCVHDTVHDSKALVGRPLPIQLSRPRPSQQVEVNERCAVQHARTEPADQSVLREYPPAAPVGRPGGIGLTEEQRYLWDLEGVLHLKNCISAQELHAARAAVDKYASFEAHPHDLVEGFQVPEGGRGSFPHGFAFHPALEALTWHPKVAPALLELTVRGRACLRVRTKFVTLVGDGTGWQAEAFLWHAHGAGFGVCWGQISLCSRRSRLGFSAACGCCWTLPRR